LKTLIQRKQYKLVLDLTKSCQDIDSVAFRISAHIGLGNLDDALSLIKKHQDEFGDATFNIMKVHFEILLAKHLYDQAYEEVEIYKNLPYISQEVEEYINDAEKMIRAHERSHNKNRKKSKEEIYDILENENDSLVLLSALNDIRSYNIGDFFDLLVWFMKRKNINTFVDTYPLLLLVSGGYDKPVSFNKNNKQYTVTPKDLEPPFVNDNYNKVIKLVENTAKDPAVSEAANFLLNELIIILYPDNIFDISISLLSGALLSMAYDHFKIPRDDKALAARLEIGEEELKQLIKSLNDYLVDNPPIEANK
ncbi:MAG: hypothetical protein WC215_03850, partial [Bacilli bacterium]